MVCEKKCSSNQKPQKGVSFAPSFPPLMGVCNALASREMRNRYQNRVVTFFAEKLLGVVHKISKQEQADHYHVVVIVIRYLKYL